MPRQAWEGFAADRGIGEPDRAGNGATRGIYLIGLRQNHDMVFTPDALSSIRLGGHLSIGAQSSGEMT